MELPNQALWHAFEDGRKFQTESGTFVEMSVRDAGSLALPTGRIVISDPFDDPWGEPLATEVEPGSYPIYLALADRAVGLVMVLFGDPPPVNWRPTKPERLWVDSATGCLMDQKVSRYLRRKAEAGKYDRYMERFRAALDENEERWASCFIRDEPGPNVFVFRTLGGDGAFPSFFGFNRDGKLVCLVIDMLLELL